MKLSFIFTVDKFVPLTLIIWLLSPLSLHSIDLIVE
jgi:hypothetical protein